MPFDITKMQFEIENINYNEFRLQGSPLSLLFWVSIAGKRSKIASKKYVKKHTLYQELYIFIHFLLNNEPGVSK